MGNSTGLLRKNLLEEIRLRRLVRLIFCPQLFPAFLPESFSTRGPSPAS